MPVFECFCPNHPNGQVFAAFDAPKLQDAVAEWKRQNLNQDCEVCGERQKVWRVQMAFDPSRMTRDEAQRDMERAVNALFPDRAPFILQALSKCSVGAHAELYEAAKALYFGVLSIPLNVTSGPLFDAIVKIRPMLGEEPRK